MLKATTKAINRPIETGKYTATFSSLREGKTDADTMLTFKDVESGKSINAFVNNSRVIYTDEQSGAQYTSEDFFFIGLKQQLKLYDEVSPMEVLRLASETPVTLWVISDEYTNVYTSKPKTFDTSELGL